MVHAMQEKILGGHHGINLLKTSFISEKEFFLVEISVRESFQNCKKLLK